MVNARELPSHGRPDGEQNIDEHRKRLLELGKRAADERVPEEFMRRNSETL
jgi:hypothetical protein